MANTVTRLTANGVYQSSGGFDEVSLNSGSIMFNGSSYLTVPQNTNFNPGNTDYTIECWVNINTNSVIQAIADNRELTGPNGFLFRILANNVFQYAAYSAVNSPVVTLNSPTVIPNNTWTHIAVTKNSINYTLWINGANTNYGSNTTNAVDGGTNLTIGQDPNNAGRFLNGYLSNFRIIKGKSVYTSNFIPQASPLSPISNTSLLLSVNPQNPFVDSSTNNFAITKNGTPTFNTLGPFYYPANTSINLANTNNNPVLGTNTNIISSTTSNGVVMISNGFDEVTLNGGSIKQRTSNTGTMLVGGYFDEVSSIT